MFQVGKFLQLTATFVGGFVDAFSKGWLLASVMLSSIPPIVIAGAAMSWAVSRLSSQGQAKYNEARVHLVGLLALVHVVRRPLVELLRLQH